MNLLAIPGEAFVASLSPDLAIRWLGLRREKGTFSTFFWVLLSPSGGVLREVLLIVLERHGCIFEWWKYHCDLITSAQLSDPPHDSINVWQMHGEVHGGTCFYEYPQSGYAA